MSDGLPSSDVHSVASLPSGGVIVGTAQGAALVNGDRVRPLGDKQGLHVRAVWAVAAWGDTVALGTSHGLWIGRAVKGPRPAWRRLSVAEGSLVDDWVTALAVRGPNDVLVGSYSHGVSRLTDLASPHPRATHFGGGYVNLGGLLVRGDRVLAATMDGLKERTIDPGLADARAPDSLADLPSPDGAWTDLSASLPGRDATSLLADSSGRIVVGTRRGVAFLSK